MVKKWIIILIVYVTSIKLLNSLIIFSLIYIFICRSEVQNFHLDGHPVTVYKIHPGNSIRITDPSDILMLRNENTFIVEEAKLCVILPRPKADTPSGYSSDQLQDYLNHLLTEFTPNPLVIQHEHLDCDLSHVMSRGLILWAYDKGYSVKAIGNKIVCER